jgi:hypothetical protein
LLPWAGKSWGEHSSNGWYLTTSPDHYRCHFIFVKATRAKQISDTVYFKHKHITQPTLSTEDLVIKAIQDLSNAIKGGSKLGSNAQMDAIKGLTDALRPGNQMPLHTHTPRVHVEASPRVHIAAPPRVQVDAPPRVQFNIEGNEEIHPDTSPAPPRLIVTSPKPILKQPTIIPSESIADRSNEGAKCHRHPLLNVWPNDVENLPSQFSISTPINYLNTVNCCETPNTKKSGPKQEQMNSAD